MNNRYHKINLNLLLTDMLKSGQLSNSIHHFSKYAYLNEGDCKEKSRTVFLVLKDKKL